MQHCMDLLEYCAIQSLSNSIVLWGIMDGKFLSGAIPLEMSNKIISSVLTSTVRMKDTYNSFILREALYSLYTWRVSLFHLRR